MDSKVRTFVDLTACGSDEVARSYLEVSQVFFLGFRLRIETSTTLLPSFSSLAASFRSQTLTSHVDWLQKTKSVTRTLPTLNSFSAMDPTLQSKEKGFQETLFRRNPLIWLVCTHHQTP